MTVFTQPLDIANRALQRCGAPRVSSLTQDSKSADEVNFCYDKLRVAELRRNVWRFAVRLAAVRAIDTTTMTVVPPAYDATKTYLVGSIVSSGGVVYIGRDSVPISSPPATNPTLWDQYFGPLNASPWDDTLSYFAGELVYTPATEGYGVYLSLQSNNSDDPTATADWDATATYNIGATVTFAATVWQSLKDLNINVTPGTDALSWVAVPGTQPDVPKGQKWLKVHTTLRSITLVYPLGSGPQRESTSRNVYQLPNGYLRMAPQAPKQGSHSFLGAPSSPPYDDWDLSSNYFVTFESQPIVLRFVADVADVTQMDPMFCEGLSCRVAFEVCEPLTQSASKLTNIAAEYKQYMGDARKVNGIELGPVEMPIDDWLSCRV